MASDAALSATKREATSIFEELLEAIAALRSAGEGVATAEATDDILISRARLVKKILG